MQQARAHAARVCLSLRKSARRIRPKTERERGAPTIDPGKTRAVRRERGAPGAEPTTEPPSVRRTQHHNHENNNKRPPLARGASSRRRRARLHDEAAVAERSGTRDVRAREPRVLPALRRERWTSVGLRRLRWPRIPGPKSLGDDACDVELYAVEGEDVYDSMGVRRDCCPGLEPTLEDRDPSDPLIGTWPQIIVCREPSARRNLRGEA